MKLAIETTPQSVHIVRLPFGSDLLQELTRYCREQKIQLAVLSGLGAVSRARIAFYDQQTRAYVERNLDGPYEILALTGNVSVKDGESFVHAHAVLGDDQGRSVGGHLLEGTIVFACECALFVLAGPALVRKPDPETGLSLWEKCTTES